MNDQGEGPDGLDQVFDALANRHRRAIVHSLGLHPYSISQLALMRDLSLPAIHKHVKVLEGAGLVRRRKQGRTTFLLLDPRALQQVQDWAGQFHPYWGGGDPSYQNYGRFLGSTPAATPEPPNEGDLRT